MNFCKLDIFNASLAAASKAEQEQNIQPGSHAWPSQGTAQAPFSLHKPPLLPSSRESICLIMVLGLLIASYKKPT